jgi:hypothetical protein
VFNPNRIVNATALNFGGYDGSALKAAQSDITVRCSNLTLDTAALAVRNADSTAVLHCHRPPLQKCGLHPPAESLKSRSVSGNQGSP